MTPKAPDLTYRLPKVLIASSREEVEEIYRFRYPIYVKELGKGARPDEHQQKRLCDELDATGTHLYVKNGDCVVAALRVARGDDGPWGHWFEKAYGVSRFLEYWPRQALSFSARMMVEKKLRGLPSATALSLSAYQIGCERNVDFSFIHTAEHLVGFFEHLGFRRYKGGFEDGAVGWRIPMVLLLKDHEHLLRIGSCLIEIARNFKADHSATAWLEREFPECVQ